MRTQNVILFYESFSESESSLGHDKPVTMTEAQFQEAYGFCYRNRSSIALHEDLKTIEKSMAESQRMLTKARRKHCKRKRSTLRVPKLENIEEEDLSDFLEPKIPLSDDSKDKRDLAAIHRERALSCGAAFPEKNEGQRFRHKKHTRIRRKSNYT